MAENSLQYMAMKLHAGDHSVEETLCWMRENGSSVTLNYGEDTGAWECSWISGGKRFTGNQVLMRKAILEALNKCFADACRAEPGTLIQGTYQAADRILNEEPNLTGKPFASGGIVPDTHDYIVGLGFVESTKPMDEIDILLYMPGSLVCETCGFKLQKRTMSMSTGTVGIRKGGEPIEPCPNDGTMMRRETWQEAYSESSDGYYRTMLALIESVKLQSHYAGLLNSHDGGARLQFTCPAEWMQRLEECGTIPKPERKQK